MTSCSQDCYNWKLRSWYSFQEYTFCLSKYVSPASLLFVHFINGARAAQLFRSWKFCLIRNKTNQPTHSKQPAKRWPVQRPVKIAVKTGFWASHTSKLKEVSTHLTLTVTLLLIKYTPAPILHKFTPHIPKALPGRHKDTLKPTATWGALQLLLSVPKTTNVKVARICLNKLWSYFSLKFRHTWKVSEVATLDKQRIKIFWF